MFRSCLHCVLNYSHDVCQFKRDLNINRLSPFFLKFWNYTVTGMNVVILDRSLVEHHFNLTCLCSRLPVTLTLVVPVDWRRALSEGAAPQTFKTPPKQSG